MVWGSGSQTGLSRKGEGWGPPHLNWEPGNGKDTLAKHARTTGALGSLGAQPPPPQAAQGWLPTTKVAPSGTQINTESIPDQIKKKILVKVICVAVFSVFSVYSVITCISLGAGHTSMEQEDP